MNNMPPAATVADVPVTSIRNLDFIDILIILAKRKRLIIGLPIVVGIVAALLSLLMPNVYKANTKLLPPQQGQSSAAAILAQFSGVAGGVVSAGIKNPNDLYIGMLRSRAIADRLIERFDLKKVYDTTSAEVARKTLDSNTAILSGKDSLILIEVEDVDKQLVAKLTNAYAEELLKLTKKVAVTEASQRRLFFERQLELSKNNLASAELMLKGALASSGVISVDSASRAAVETAARLRAQLASKEIQLNAMQAFVTHNNQEFKRAQQEVRSLREELSKLENGQPEKAATLANSSARADGLESIKVLREVKYHQMLYELLSKQYEIARLDEAKDSSIIQVLDIAVEPERKFKPKRAVLVLLAAIVAFFMALVWTFLKESQLNNPANMAQWQELKSLLRFRRSDVVLK